MDPPLIEKVKKEPRTPPLSLNRGQGMKEVSEDGSSSQKTVEKAQEDDVVGESPSVEKPEEAQLADEEGEGSSSSNSTPQKKQVMCMATATGNANTDTEKPKKKQVVCVATVTRNTNTDTEKPGKKQVVCMATVTRNTNTDTEKPKKKQVVCMATATGNTNTDTEKVTSPEKSTEGDASKGKKSKKTLGTLVSRRVTQSNKTK